MTSDHRTSSDAPRIRQRRTPTFYERALSASDRELFQEALGVEGIDAEVALLRVHIHQLMEEQPQDSEAVRAGIRLLVMALSARHRLTGAEAETLTEATTALFAQFVAAFSTGGDPDE